MTIVPLRLISITNESHQVAGESPLYASLYKLPIFFTESGQKYNMNIPELFLLKYACIKNSNTLLILGEW